MNRIPAILIASLLAAAGVAQADELASYPQGAHNAPAASSFALPATSDSAVALGEAAGYPSVVAQGAAKSRAEVLAEVEQARRDGTLMTNEAGLPLQAAPRTAATSFAGRAARPAL